MGSIITLTAEQGAEKSAIQRSDKRTAKKGSGIEVKITAAGMTRADALELLRQCEAELTTMDFPG